MNKLLSLIFSGREALVSTVQANPWFYLKARQCGAQAVQLYLHSFSGNWKQEVPVPGDLPKRELDPQLAPNVAQQYFFLTIAELIHPLRDVHAELSRRSVH
ncbi:hypothetical protein BLNAU_11013 [Blattamonas nauphoetae]|uniref:Uncharacterized protein n=1 Tax=Blattamonas nauphoetae TaxID=2049346 RepID=A0ABQ9XR38_9EUKA|nr:hypothetical protein BLNAU_11013 [Blattamonas nauphoetae]